MKSIKLSQKLTESALMLAIATILSFVKIVELPFGGAITLASMLPMVILSYRFGAGWGSLSCLTFSLIQLLMGLNNLSYATSFAAAIAIVLLDYIFAFTGTAIGAAFRKMKHQQTAIGLAAFSACMIRFLCHTISGCTVWAGVSIPTGDAFVYSLVYNAAYMIPETIITVVLAVFVAAALDFSQKNICAQTKEDVPDNISVFSLICGIIAIGAMVTAAVFVFPQLQNENGFDITGFANVNVPVVALLLVVAALAITAIVILRNVKRKKDE